MVATYKNTLWVGKHWQHRINLIGYLNWVRALSADGKIAGGGAVNDTYYSAVIWSGENWKIKTGLSTKTSEVKALSADGKIAGGWGYSDGRPVAVIWSGENWQTKTELTVGSAEVRTLSADGKIAGGLYSSRNNRAIIWSGKNWLTLTFLDTLTANNSGNSQVNALSADGKIAGGQADSDNSNGRAVIWSGENWQTKTDLGTLTADNSGRSEVRALSADGKIAGGWADNYGNRAVIWSGKNWQTKTDLGTLRADNSGDSAVYALSADGTLAGGWAYADDGKRYATLWRLKYDANRSLTEHKVLTKADIQPEHPTEPTPEPPATPEPAEPTTPVTEPTQPTSPTPALQPETPSVPLTPLTPAVEIVGKINLDFTHQALRQFGADTFHLMAMQQHALHRLQQPCVNTQRHCYRITSDVSGTAESKDTALGFGYGYRLENGVMLGLNLDRSLQRQLPQSYQRSPNNLGVGLFADWQGERWFVTPAVAWDFYNAKTKRPQFSNTEANQQTTQIKGLAASLTLGQRIHWADKQVGWYLAGRFNQVTRSGYTEQNLAFPIQFGKTQLQETTLAFGLNSQLPLSSKLSWLLNAEVEQKLAGKNPVYTAQGEGVGSFRFEGKPNHTRFTFGTGLRYAFTPNVRVEIMPYVERASVGKQRYGSRFNLVGSF